MKFRMKKSDERFTVELNPGGGKKPIVVQLTPEQLDSLLALVEVAKRSSSFEFSLEL